MIPNVKWTQSKGYSVQVECDTSEENKQRWKSNPCRHGICYGGLNPGSCFCDPDGKGNEQIKPFL